jgi:hypothetical protein
MSEHANVDDLDVFRLFRAALIKFASTAGQSLANAESHIGRTQSWLTSDQPTYWQGQLRKRGEAVVKAQEAVRHIKIFKDFAGQTRSAVEEQKALVKCQAAFAEAERKIDAIRKWNLRLQKESDLYRGGVARLNETISSDIPKAVALLDRLAASLEQYVQLDSSSGVVPDGGMLEGGAMTRGEPADGPVPPDAPAAADRGVETPAANLPEPPNVPEA